MIPLSPTPLTTPIIVDKALTIQWAKYFRDIQALLGFANNHSAEITPTLTGVTEVGTVNKTFVYVKDRNLVQVELILAPVGAGTVALSAGVSLLANLPFAASHDAAGILVNLSTLAIVGAVAVAAGTKQLDFPTLGATSAKHVAMITYRTDNA
jgi:hypothetical protein